MTTLPAAIADAFARDPSRPLLTWYDDATGERVELSVATTANWVAKTANMLRDSLDVQPGDRVAVALPLHWQTTVVHLATWLAGACVVALEPGSVLPPSAVAFIPEASLASTARHRGTEVVALSLRPLAGRLVAAPPGVLDFAVEVPVHGDHFTPGLVASSPAAVDDGEQFGANDLLAAAHACPVEAGDRALVLHDPWTRAGLVACGLGPLLRGSAVLICGALSIPALPRRIEEEHVSVVLATDDHVAALPAAAAALLAPLRR